MEKKPRPLRARDRPLVLGAQGEALAGAADVQRHSWLLRPAGVFAFEKMAKKPFLQPDAVVAVEMGEVRIAVHLEPLLLRAGAQEAFEVAARVQALATPVRRREQRRLDLLELDHAFAVVAVDERAAQRFAGGIGGILREHLGRERLRAG